MSASVPVCSFDVDVHANDHNLAYRPDSLCEFVSRNSHQMTKITGAHLNLVVEYHLQYPVEVQSV